MPPAGFGIYKIKPTGCLPLVKFYFDTAIYISEQVNRPLIVNLGYPGNIGRVNIKLTGISIIYGVYGLATIGRAKAKCATGGIFPHIKITAPIKEKVFFSITIIIPDKGP